jgi:glycerol-3-phosphate acyltransferase PlsY
MAGLFTTIAAYLLGSIPFGYLIVRWQRGIDVRSTGSGSIGATNVMRNLGLAGFAATFLLDFGKGAAAVFLAMRFTGSVPTWYAAAALAAVVGHCFPVWLKFRGGKGVATGAGAFVVLAPFQVLCVALLFAVVVGIWRYVSLGSITAIAAFPILLHFQGRAPLPLVLGSAACAAVVIGCHRTNIRRLLEGTENRLGKKRALVRGQ